MSATTYSKSSSPATNLPGLWPLPEQGGVEFKVASFFAPLFRATYDFVVAVGVFARRDESAHVLIQGGRFRTDQLTRTTGALVPILASRCSLIVKTAAQSPPPALLRAIHHATEIVQKVAAEEEAGVRREERRRMTGF